MTIPRLPLAAAISAAIIAAACASGGTSADQSDEGGAPAPAAPTSAAPAVSKIGAGSYKYGDGLQVAVLSAKRFPISSAAAGGQPGDIGVKVTVRVTNGTKNAFDASGLQITLKAGPDQVAAERVFDTSVGEELAGKTAPGRPASGTYGFAVPKASAADISVNITPDYEHEEVIFAGAAT